MPGRKARPDAATQQVIAEASSDDWPFGQSGRSKRRPYGRRVPARLTAPLRSARAGRPR
jgi:hypothetical protein